MSLLAEAYEKVGSVTEGISAVEEALAVVEKSDERLCEAELLRRKGELLLKSEGGRQNEASLAEAIFLKAIEVAQRQAAKSLELRAVMSLSRLWQRQGTGDTAGQMLAEIYDWFSEGFDTPDLVEAKALLKRLIGGETTTDKEING